MYIVFVRGSRGNSDGVMNHLFPMKGYMSFDTRAIGTEDISYSRCFRNSLFGTQTISDSNRL